MDFSSDDAVMAALSNAAASDPDFGGTPPAEQAPPAPQTPEPPAGETQPEVQPQAQPVDPAAPVDTFDDGAFNPDNLPAELQAGWKQLQAAYTRKTQQVAEERRAFEQLGSPEEVQQAVQLYSRISDPRNWPQLHADLSDLMQQYGMTPAEADAHAAAAMEQAASTEPSAPAVPADIDPELAPLYQEMQQTKAELAQLRAEREQAAEARAQEEQAERLRLAIDGELTRQENAIMQANPTYGQGDMDAIYELSSYFGGNLIQAQARYEALRSEWVGRYVEQKSSAADAQGAHPVPVVAPPATQTGEKKTLEQVGAEAEEYFRQLQAAGELPEF